MIESIIEHAKKGCRWLAGRQDPDGGWRGLPEARVDAFYKAGWAFMEAGRPAAARRALNYARRHFLTAEGDFLPRVDSPAIRIHYLYHNSYFVIGSMLTGRYDISVPACRFLLTRQSVRHGGFYSFPPAPAAESPADTMSTGAAGLACLATGNLEAARRAADYLAHIARIQPGPGSRFFTTTHPDGNLCTNFEGRDAFWRVIETTKPEQCWYALGLPFAFLVQIAAATGETEYRRLAQSYFEIQNRCVSPWDGYSSGKAGWACAMLYRMTGEEVYRDIALHIAGKIISRQTPDGGWYSSGAVNGKYPQVTDADMDLTSEFTLWLSLISTNVLSRQPCEIPSDVTVPEGWQKLIKASVPSIYRRICTLGRH